MGSPMHSHRTLSPPLSWSAADEHRLSGGDGGPSAVPGDFVGRMAHEQGQVLLPDRVVRRGLVCFDTAPQFWRHRLDERHSRHTEGVTEDHPPGVDLATVPTPVRRAMSQTPGWSWSSAPRMDDAPAVYRWHASVSSHGTISHT